MPGTYSAATHSQENRRRVALLAVTPNTGEPTGTAQIGGALPAVILGAGAADATTLERAGIGAAAVAVEVAGLAVRYAAGHAWQGVAADTDARSGTLAAVRATRAQRQPVAVA